MFESLETKLAAVPWPPSDSGAIISPDQARETRLPLMAAGWYGA
ncbi:hypothetical protein [Rhizobium leguminosarum]|nr:hypothetical protein [Rhizobium leguminosarum]